MIPNEGEVRLLTDLLSAGEDWELGLITGSGYTPAASDDVSDVEAVEADFSGYARKTLDREVGAGKWSTPTSVAPTAGWSAEAAVAESQYNADSPQSWVYAGDPATIYGYFFVGASSDKLIKVIMFDPAQPVVNGNDVKIVPRFGSTNVVPPA